MKTVSDMKLSEVNDLGIHWADMVGALATVRAHIAAHKRLNSHLRNTFRAKGVTDPEVMDKLRRLDELTNKMVDLEVRVKAQVASLESLYRAATPKGFP